MQWAKKQHGFTIVELLIVIVVIAILAAITIVAYNGISNRAKASAAQSAAAQATKKVMTYAVDNADQYPPDLASVGVTNSGDTSYQYSVNNAVSPRTYCITATTSNISYFESSTSGSPTAGGCPGHSIDGVSAITNLVTNPSVESNTTGWSLAINGSVATRTAGSALLGGFGIDATAPANSTDSGVSIPVSGTLTSGTQYTASFSLRAITAGEYSLSVQGTAGTTTRDNRILTAGQTARFSLTWTPTATGTTTFYGLRRGGQAGSHNFYIDGAMLVANSTSTTYSDGASPNWAWNGTVNNSTSTGIPQ